MIMPLLSIMQQNIDRNNTDITEMMNIIMSSQPHVIFFSEFREETHRKTIIERINSEYSIVYPESYNEKSTRQLKYAF